MVCFGSRPKKRMKTRWRAGKLFFAFMIHVIAGLTPRLISFENNYQREVFHVRYDFCGV